MSFHMGSDGNTNSFSFPLVDENGTLNTAGLENFAKKVNLTQFEHNYAIVSIMGPQSSGKSTLLNSLFGTNFREMDAFNERCRATKGIWLAKSTHRKDCILVMDLEGTDGEERQATESTIKALRNRIQEVWENSLEPKGGEDAQLSEDFNIDIVLLPSFEYRKDDFRKEVENLRQKLVNSVLSDRLAGGETDIGLASDFGINVTKIWNEIKENEILHLPSHKSMLATIRCEEIASQKLSAFKEDEAWLELKAKVDPLPEKDIGNRLRSIIGKYLSELAEALKDWSGSAAEESHQ